MAASAQRKSTDHPRQVNLTLDEAGANVLLDSEIVHREDVAEGEGPVVDGRDASGDTHPAVNRAIRWAQEQGYKVAVILW